MDSIVYGIVISAIVFIVFLFTKKEVKKSELNMDENNFVLRQPKIFLWVGIICAGFFSALIVFAILYPNETSVWWVYLIFGFFAALGLYLIFYCIRWEIKIEDNQISYTPSIGKKRLFTFDQITNVKYKPGQKITAFSGTKKLLSVDFSSKGFNVLAFRLKKEEMCKKIEEMFEPLAVDSVHLIKTENDVFTKIGGQPLAGKNFEWPKWKNQSMAFIMQIKLSEIAVLSQIKLFPQKGFLYVFYDKEQSIWGFDPNDKGSWKIIFEPEHDDLMTIPYPKDLEDNYRYNEKKLEAKLIKTYPSWEDKQVDALNLTDELLDWYVNFSVSVYGKEPGHQIAGIAAAVQSPDMDLECQLVTNGLYCGDGSGYEDPRREELEKNKSDWTILLQIDSDDDAGIMWGDMGKLYFWIKKSDLEKSMFQNVWMILQCG